jgi:hypothetical protein
MSVNFLHSSVAAGQAAPRRQGRDRIDWRAARRAGRACCCPAKPAVIAVMPPTKARPHETDLLLCGHHYRMSRQALAAAGAAVVAIDEPRPVDGAWPLGRVGV